MFKGVSCASVLKFLPRTDLLSVVPSWPETEAAAAERTQH